MATVATTRQSLSSQSAQAPAKRLSLADVRTNGSGLPSRYIIYGPEGAGKTSLGAQTPSPIFIQTTGETGLETLIDNGRLGDVAHFPECATFGDLLGAIEALTVDEHSYRTLVIDTLNGAEELCHDAVCKRDFGGKRANDGFAAYGKGPEVALADWRVLLSALDRLRSQRKMSIVCLCHAKIAPFKNPEGEDYDRYRPTLHDKTWGLTLKWADAALFVNFETFTEKDGLRAKGRGGQQRVMYTERRAAFDAKNRHGLAPEILLGNSAAEAWAAFSAALKEGRATAQQTN